MRLPIPLSWRLRARRSAVYWIAALALAGVTATVVASLLGQAEAAARRYGGAREVPVMARAVAAGATIGPADVAYRPVPAALLPRADVAADPVGRTALVALVPGEVLVAARVAPSGLRGVAALLGPGERAVGVPKGTATPPLGVGDRVDLLASYDDEPALVVARGARVLDVAERAVTVAVLTDHAPAIATALAGAAVTLVLAAP